MLGTAVFLADRLMLARYHQDALASMQLQGPLLWSVTSVFMAICAGTVALVARCTGAGDLARARAVARASLRIAFVIGLAVAVVGVVGLDEIVVIFGPREESLRALSREYLSITFSCLPATFVATSASMILAGGGDTRSPLLAGFLANGINIAINAVLIFGADLGAVRVPELGVQGAAIGTAVAFVVEAIVLVAVLGRRGHPLCVGALWRRSDPEHGRDDGSARRDVLRLSGPAVAERVVVHIGFVAFAKAITELGPLAMAANQALITVESICFLCADGFGIAAATVMGQRLGRGDPTGARHGGFVATMLATLSITLVGILLWASGRWTLPIFVAPGEDGTAFLATGLALLPILAMAQPFMTTSIVLANGLRGAGDTRSPLVAALLGGLVVRVSLAWTLGIALDLGLPGIWYASTIDWVVRT
ncbi:MAG TPA: MATE family efflux transporter, partial [Nannocystaceae bacterium]|nr:MATE family efflux transporter [Nannocystaceae bacterium]